MKTCDDHVTRPKVPENSCKKVLGPRPQAFGTFLGLNDPTQLSFPSQSRSYYYTALNCKIAGFGCKQYTAE